MKTKKHTIMFAAMSLSIGTFAGSAFAQDAPSTPDVEHDDAVPSNSERTAIGSEDDDDSEAQKTTNDLNRNLSAPYDETVATDDMNGDGKADVPPPAVIDDRDVNVNMGRDDDNDNDDIDDDDDAPFYSRYGLGLSAGAGVSNFTNSNINGLTDAGGAWTARLIFGTRSPLAVEAAYIGTANNIQTLGLDDATLLSNGAEGALRLHVVQIPFDDEETVMLKPYVLAGFAWKHYSLSGADFNTSSVQESDNVYEVPLGLGLDWNFGRFIADQRFDYRPAIDSDLVAATVDGGDNSLQTWSLSARVGVEF